MNHLRIEVRPDSLIGAVPLLVFTLDEANFHVMHNGAPFPLRLLTEVEYVIPPTAIDLVKRFDEAGVETIEVELQTLIAWVSACWREAGRREFPLAASISIRGNIESFDLKHMGSVPESCISHLEVFMSRIIRFNIPLFIAVFLLTVAFGVTHVRAAAAPLAPNGQGTNTEGLAPISLPLNVSPDWWAAVQEDIRQSASSPVSLSAAANWTVVSDFGGAQLGYSMATAGDVNGDGYSDVIVGAPYYNNGQMSEGRVYVYYGSANGLSTTANWIAEGGQANADLGISVAAAGDVNNDGYSDIIVGADGYDGKGAAFVWHGSASGLSCGAGCPVSPTSANWKPVSDQSGSKFGVSVGTAGDVNGDGYSDVIVGASGYDNNAIADAGRVFVYNGSSSGLVATPGWSALHDQAGANFGNAVATAGDVNSDGHSDLIVGAYHYDDGAAADEGAVYIYYGDLTCGGGCPVNAASAASWHHYIGGDYPDARFGNSVGTAGDVNGDGYADVIMAAMIFRSAYNGEGVVAVYAGSAAGVGAAPIWSALGGQENAFLGSSVSTAGDVNGDGYADIIVGAAGYSYYKGAAFVWLGAADGLGPIGSPANADWNAVCPVSTAMCSFGRTVGVAGDVNGDGYSDVVIGAVSYNTLNDGAAFAFYGAPDGLAAVSGWIGESDQVGATFGQSVSSAGDINGDGYADVIAGAPFYDASPTLTDAGRVYVYYGATNGLSASSAWITQTLTGDQAGADFGLSVGAAGDVNGDGYGDVIVGALFYDAGGITDTGQASVYYGSAVGLSATPAWTVSGEQAGESLGISVGTAGDVNGDGYSDVIVGAYHYDNGALADAGSVFVYYGSAAGLSTTPNWSAITTQAGTNLGNIVGTAGDVNGDGCSDIIIGANLYDNGLADEGMAFVFYGSAQGLACGNGCPVAAASAANWTARGNQTNAWLGNWVSTAGDVNGDGYSDIFIGARQSADDHTQEGRVFAWYGSAAGLGAAGTPENADWKTDGNQDNALYGNSVSLAGDVNGDGYSDVVVGAYRYDNGQTDEGRAYVYLGSTVGLTTTANWTAESDQANALFGSSVNTAGDVNGDGFADVIVGARAYDNGQVDEGRVYLYYGGGGRGVALTPRQMRTTSATPIALLGLSNASNSVQFYLTGHTPLGRGDVKLRWQVAPLGTPFTATIGVISGSAIWKNTGIEGVALAQIVTGLRGHTHHWRVRLLYPASNRLGQPAGRWLTIPWNGWNEARFRTPNSAPVAHDDSVTTTVNTPITIAVTFNDSDIDGDTLTVTGVTSPTHGTAAIKNGTTVVYTPTVNYTDSDAFTYTISDGHGGTATAQVILTITSSGNTPPVANNDTYTATEDLPCSVGAPGVLSNDSDVEGNPLTAVLGSGVTHGALSLHIDGSFVYTPTLNFFGTDTFTYRANDGLALSNLATVTLNVAAVNNTPTISDIPDQLAERGQTLGPIAFTVNDVDTPLDVLTLAAQSSNPTLLPVSSITFGGSGSARSVALAPTTELTGTATITVTVSDGLLNSFDTFKLTVVAQLKRVYLPLIKK